MADPSIAYKEAYQRGRDGASSSIGYNEGWNDDRKAADAREQGYRDGWRDRQRNNIKCRGRALALFLHSASRRAQANSCRNSARSCLGFLTVGSVNCKRFLTHC